MLIDNIITTQHARLQRFTLAEFPVWHGFFSRQGGFSDVPYASLNTAYRTDDPQAAKNRQYLLETMQIADNPLRIVSPSHQDNIAFIDDEQWQTQSTDVLLATDAAFTTTPNCYLLLGTADCIPAMITDQQQSFIGLVHLGWRNLVDNLAQKVIIALQQQYQAKSDQIIVGIGPAIGACCYRFEDPIQREQAFWQPYLQRQADGLYSIDLLQALGQQLVDAGVVISNIHSTPYCTGCQQDLFFSCYKEGYQSGRFPTVVGLRS